MGYDHARFVRRIAGGIRLLDPSRSVPHLTLNDAGSIVQKVGTGDKYSVSDLAGGSVHQWSYASNVSTYEGGHTTGDDLELKCNSIDARPYILIGGAGDIIIDLPSTKKLYIQDAGTVIAQIEEGGGASGGVLKLKETTTPTATADYGAIYTKSDNHLYWQSGAGVEYDLGGA